MATNNMPECVVLYGDCLTEMGKIPDGSIDTIITDPPYGLSKEPDIAEVLTHWLAGDDYEHKGGGFMGKSWDSFVPGPSVWRECFRVLKPGGTALVFAGSRTQDLMGISLRLAGFSIFDTIMWIYGSGFPKSTNISKQLDKGHKREVIGYEKDTAPDLRDVGAMSKENAGIDKLSFGQNHRPAVRTKVGITAPATPEAQLWDGWGTHLKPAFEPIICCRKPNDGTYANNALVHGVSGLNIDGARIGYEVGGNAASNPLYRKENGYKTKCGGDKNPTSFKVRDEAQEMNINLKGRFPANVILDEEAGRMLDEQTGSVDGDTRKSKSTYDKGAWGNMGAVQSNALYNDKGGASRFFYCAKASKKERNAGCEDLEEKRGSDDYRPGDDGSSGMQSRLHGATKKGTNHHPTVKPLALMEYLCTLTKTPTGGIVLDPYAGSGTTGVACINTGRHSVLIEKESTYWSIIDKRIANALATERVINEKNISSNSIQPS